VTVCAIPRKPAASPTLRLMPPASNAALTLAGSVLASWPSVLMPALSSALTVASSANLTDPMGASLVDTPAFRPIVPMTGMGNP